MRALAVIALLFGALLTYFGMELEDSFMTKIGHFAILGTVFVTLIFRVKRDMKRLDR